MKHSPRPHKKAAILAACSLLGLVLPAQSAVVGYWRFEDSGNLGTDSSPNGLNLTTTGGTAAATASVPLGTVPQTGAASGGALDLEVDSGADYLSIPDNNTFFNFQSFTVEAYITLESIGSDNTQSRIIASQLSSTNVAWQFGVAGSGSGLGTGSLFLAAAGTTLQNFDPDATVSSPWNLTAGNSYYVAVSLNINASTGATATYYLQNLTAGTPMITTTTALNANVKTLGNSGADFVIGGSFTGVTTVGRGFDGVVDEVRLSTGVLSQSELLNVPESGTGALALGAIALWFGFGRGFRFQNRKVSANS